MLDDHSELVPLLPIPNRTVKRLSADDSADSRVKVGHCQAITAKTPHLMWGVFFCLVPGVWFYTSQGTAFTTSLNISRRWAAKAVRAPQAPELHIVDEVALNVHGLTFDEFSQNHLQPLLKGLGRGLQLV